MITMKELQRIQVLQKLLDKTMIQKTASLELSLSIRQIQPLFAKYKEKGKEGLISIRRGRASPNRIDLKIKNKILQKIQKEYSDFGRTPLKSQGKTF